MLNLNKLLFIYSFVLFLLVNFVYKINLLKKIEVNTLIFEQQRFRRVCTKAQTCKNHHRMKQTDVIGHSYPLIINCSL